MSNQSEYWKHSEADKILSDLRAEVAAQKTCITQHTFQAVGFAAILWGLALKSDVVGKGVTLYICGALVVFMMLVVVRMANHKYCTMNRNLAYELHLHRLRDYAANGSERLCRKMLEIGWEEAMCAWRIIMPTLFELPYFNASNFLLPHRTRPGHHAHEKEYRWYDTKALMVRGAVYHPGNYLRNVHWMLNAVALFSISVMAFFYNQQFRNHSAWPTSAEQWGALVCIVLVSVYWFTQWYRHKSLRRVLESELLSIQSSAVVWRVVALCHILAVAVAFRRNGCYKYYTSYLALLAVDFNRSFYEPHKWMQTWESLVDSDKVFKALNKIIPPDETITELRKERPPKRMFML